MNIPKVKFKVMPLEDNIEVIKWSFYEEDKDLGVKNYTIKYFPELNNIDISISKEEAYKIIEQVVTKKYEEEKNRLSNEVDRYNKIWNQYNDKYFEMLSNYLEVEFPDNIKEIVAQVGFIPVFPRYLDSFSFDISTDVEESKLIEVTAHETLHFLWFIKWNIIHPETPSSHFESPYIEWKYSEMVTDPILNNKPFNELFNFRERGYDSFYELHDGDILVMDKLRDIYSTNDDINVKIKNGFEYINKVL